MSIMHFARTIEGDALGHTRYEAQSPLFQHKASVFTTNYLAGEPTRIIASKDDWNAVYRLNNIQRNLTA
jgi:hypothetical protein